MISGAKRLRVYRRDGYACGDCGRQMAPFDQMLSLDHTLPRSKGGTDTESNLVTMCEPCNQRKRNRVPDGADHFALWLHEYRRLAGVFTAADPGR